MKKLINVFILWGIILCFFTGCAAIVENPGEGSGAYESSIPVDEIQVEDASVMEEGYYAVEGTLREIGKEALILETAQGQCIHFKLAPETIVYPGEDSDGIPEGESVKVVFDGKLNGTKMEEVFVIAVTVPEKE